LRNLLLTGTAGLFLALGAANAYAVPQNSPYATIVPPGAVDGYNYDPAPVYGDQGYGSEGAPMVEGRSAYVYPDYDAGYVDPGYGYAPPDGGFYFGGGRSGNFGRGGHIGAWHFGSGHFHR
jgi:hypothetical protein